MGERAFGIFELLLVFCGVLGWGFWELYSPRRDRLRAERDRAQPDKLE